jgi:S1-C subfamily serine protease
VIDGRRGLVLTNAHVIAGATSMKATLNGNEVNAVAVGKAPCEDLAVVQLRPRPSGLRSARLGRGSSVRAGDRVTALGYPGAFEEDISQRRLQTTDGIVSSPVGPGSLGPDLPELQALIQHQAPISGGNSGGPLFDETGAVVGINTVSTGGDSQNQNGAISIDRAKGLLPDLRSGTNLGYVGWDLRTAQSNGTTFVYVRAADPNSPADRAGLAGAILVELDDTEVSTVSDVCSIVSGKSSGDPLKVGVLASGGRVLTLRTRLR